ncbi:MAG: hypothetical protein Q9170_004578 [Blastenia crenularia]
MDKGIIAITQDNIRKLKYIAKFCTCCDHQAQSTDFAYHWLASSRLAGFLDHMGWKADAIEWKCLASGDAPCTSVLDCFSSAALHDTIRGLLNRIIIHEEPLISSLELARHWLCRQHYQNRKTSQKTLKALRQQCRVYWSDIGLYKQNTQRPGPRAGDDTSNLEDDSSQLDNSDSITLDPDLSNTMLSNDTLDETTAPPQVSQSANFDTGRSYRPPGTYDEDETSAFGKEPTHESPVSSPSIRTVSTPGIPQAPPFRRCKSVSSATIFNNTLRRIQKEPPPQTDHKNNGYIYVCVSIGSPNHVKVGRTIQTIEEREKQIIRCSGDVTQVKKECNISRVPQHVWLETVILATLKSRQCSFKCLRHLRHNRNTCDKGMEHHEWFEADANEIAVCVELWRQWMRSDPYDDNGCLFPKWQRRIDFFETSTSRYQYLLAEPDPCKAWATFLDPPWWIRLHMMFYEEFFQPRGKLRCRLEVDRTHRTAAIIWVPLVLNSYGITFDFSVRVVSFGLATMIDGRKPDERVTLE